MRVVCENCGATYKIPDTKLVKAVNKATCRKCGFKMMIQRPRSAATEAAQTADPTEAQTVVKQAPSSSDAELLEANTLVGQQSVEEQEWSDEAPTQVQVPDGPPSPPPQVPPRKDIPHPDTTAPRVYAATDKAPMDMLLALVGAFSSAGGALLLAVNTAGSPTMRFIGLAVALAGSLTTLFLLVTGNVGRQKGNIPLSVGLGSLLALGATGAIHVASGTSTATAPAVASEAPAEEVEAPVEVVADLVEQTIEAADEIAEAAEEIIEEAPEEIVDTLEDAVEEVVEEVAEVVPVAEPEFDPQAEEERRRREEEARKRREEERRRAAAASTPPPATPAPPKLKSIPLSVVDTLIRTNLSIKRCFFQEKQRTGQLPSRVTVRFTVLPSGRVSAARVGTAEFQGGPLDSCLGRAFRNIQFPPFDGEPLNMTYPFVL